MDPLHTHSESGRRPLTLAMFGMSGALLALGVWGSAPWFWFVPVGFAALGLLWVVITNRQSGSVLTHDTLRFYHGEVRRTLSLTEIASMEVQTWSEGPDHIRLQLHSGEVVDVPSQSAGPGFAAAMARAGVRRVDDDPAR